jgi:hypothetical protein
MWWYLKREDESGPQSPRLCEERLLGPFWLCYLFHFSFVERSLFFSEVLRLAADQINIKIFHLTALS